MTTNGIELRVYAHGNGPAVVLAKSEAYDAFTPPIALRELGKHRRAR
ncbi:hypothetical protein [Nonomuraea lactucae]|nr:hypothetical protein [Nonomuraea lactucae]